MKSIHRIWWIAAVGLAAIGCTSGEQDSPQRSKIVSAESQEFQTGKAAQDDFERQAKEAERKELGGHSID